MSRFATLAVVFFSVACQPSDAWMDSGMELDEASGRADLVEYDLDGERALASTVKVKTSSRSGGEWKITYDLRHITKRWTLTGSCSADADNLTGEVGGGLDGCKITCHDLNRYQECSSCDIDCSDASKTTDSRNKGGLTSVY